MEKKDEGKERKNKRYKINQNRLNWKQFQLNMLKQQF